MICSHRIDENRITALREYKKQRGEPHAKQKVRKMRNYAKTEDSKRENKKRKEKQVHGKNTRRRECHVENKS